MSVWDFLEQLVPQIQSNHITASKIIPMLVGISHPTRPFFWETYNVLIESIPMRNLIIRTCAKLVLIISYFFYVEKNLMMTVVTWQKHYRVLSSSCHFRYEIYSFVTMMWHIRDDSSYDKWQFLRLSKTTLLDQIVLLKIINHD